VNPRNTGILLLVAVALGAFVYFYVIGVEEGRREAEERAKRLFPAVEPEDVEWVELTSGDGREVRAERREGGWELVQPLAFPGDAFALDGVAAALAQVQSEAVYAEPQAREVYGLDDPAREVRFGAGGSEHALRTGDKTPMGGNTYAAVEGDDAVYTVPTFRVNALEKSLDDLRDKRILAFDAEAVERVTATWPDGRVELVRGEQGWRLTAPLDARADEGVVTDLLSDLSYLRASGFEDAPGSEAQAALERPAFAVELALKAAEEGGEPRRLSLALGSALEGGERLVRAERPSLFRIAADRIDDFPREVSAYRFKQLASFAPLEARRVVLTLRHGEERVEIVATHGDSGWQASPEPMAPDKIAAMVETLSRLEAKDVLAERVGADELRALLLDPPLATLAVYGERAAAAAGDAEADAGAEAGEGAAPEDAAPQEEAAEQRLAEVRIGAAHGSEGFAAQSGESPELFLLGSSEAEHLPVSLEAYRNRFLAPPQPPAPAAAPQDPAEAEFLEELREGAAAP
jgi:hypothetical protein